MKHYRIVNRFRFISFLILTIMILTLAVSAVFNRVQAKNEAKYTEVCIVEGDTLWNIAKEYGSKEKDIRRVIYDICRLNNISAADLRPGMTITVPEK